MALSWNPTVVATLGLGALLAAAPAAATNVLLDFSGNVCGPGTNQACGNGSDLGQAYGDIPGILDVSHRSLVHSTGATFESSLRFWAEGYSGLQGVAWGGNNSVTHAGEFVFTPATGYRVTLNSMDFGDYLNRNFGSSATVLDLGSGTPLWASGPFDAGLSPITFNPGVSSASGLILRFGPDSYNTGIDNLSLTVSAVPEPSTWALLLAGIGLVGTLGRRRVRI